MEIAEKIIETTTWENNLKKWIYVYIQLYHFAVHLKLTQCKSTIL